MVVSVFCFAPNSLVLVEKGSPFLFHSFLSLSLSPSPPAPHTAWGLLVGLSPTRVSIGARRLVL